MERRIKIEGTNDEYVTCALAYLAGFREGTRFERGTNNWHKDIGSECVLCFHKTTLEKADDFGEVMAHFGPDIMTYQIYKVSRENEKGWQPTDEYLIDFNEELIDGSLIEKIPEEIKRACSQYSQNKQVVC